MPLTVVWHESDTRHHIGDLIAGGTTIKGAVAITLRGGEATFDVRLKGKKFKSPPQRFAELKTLKVAAEFFLISSCGEDVLAHLLAPTEREPGASNPPDRT